MLRKEIQEKTGLTRKAVEYYEEKGFVNPRKKDNGYRDYSNHDLEILRKIAMFRKLGISLVEIEQYLSSNGNSLATLLRKKQHQLCLEEKKKLVLELILQGENQKKIDAHLAVIEAEECMYEKLERAFPGYFGQMLFSAYEAFLKEPLEKEGEEAFAKYMAYLDALPSFELSKEERDYVERVSSTWDMGSLKEVNQAKMEAIQDAKNWLKENKNFISQYEAFKNSEAYQDSIPKQIQDKLQKFMVDNKYYDLAIPLIRKFSKSYDAYYKKLLEANDSYMAMKK